MLWIASSYSNRTSRAGRAPARYGTRAAVPAHASALALLLAPPPVPMLTLSPAPPCPRGPATQDGSTLLEVLAALLIMSILGLGIWSAVSSSLRLTTKIHDSTMASTRILVLDDRLRALAGRIRAPFWVPDFLIEATDSEMHVAYLDGDPSKSLILKIDGNVLSIDDGTTVTRHSGFTRVSMAATPDSSGRVCGITVSLEEKGRASFSLTARFGSAPVTEGAAQ